MNAPAGVAIDKANGHVIVADSQNNRVMGWLSATAFAAGGAADLVIGQADFNSSGCNQNAAAPDATTLCRPIGVAFDVAHRVYVGDAQNNRVLVYDDPFAALAGSGRPAISRRRRCSGRRGVLSRMRRMKAGSARTALTVRRGWRSMRAGICSWPTLTTIARWFFSRRCR